MWDQAISWRRGGVTYRDIAARLAQEENLRRYEMEEAPGPFLLNQVGEQVTLSRDTATPVDIAPGLHRNWDLVFAPTGRGRTGGIVSSGLVYSTSVSLDVRGRLPAEMDWTK